MTRRPGHGIPVSRRRRGVTTPHEADDELEAPLLAFVRRECKARDLLHYHTHRSRRSERGFLDSVIVGPRGVYFVEEKSDLGTLRPEQVVWFRRLRAAGADAKIWTPQDRRSGRIINELNWLARPAPAPPGELTGELAKTLFLFAHAGDEPAAGLHWDAGSKHVDHELWQMNAETILRMLRGVLPRTDEQVHTWLRAHHLSDPTPAQVFAALGAELGRTAGRGS